MKKAILAIAAAATLAVGMIGTPQTAEARCNGCAVGAGVGVASGLGAWIPTVIGDPVLKKPSVALALCGALLESNRKLYKVPQRIAFAF